MATILLVEDTPDLGLYEAKLLEAAGHRVVRCGGGPTIFSACPLMHGRSCSLADEAELVMFSVRMFAAIPGRTYRGIHLLRAYRAHPVYGRLPFVVVAFGAPDHFEGAGPIEVVEKFSDPSAVLDAVRRLLEGTNLATAEVLYPDSGIEAAAVGVQMPLMAGSGPPF